MTKRIAAVGILTLAGVALAVAPSPPAGPDAAHPGQLADVRGELVAIEETIRQHERERQVIERVIELASADLEKARDDRESERIRRIVEQYRNRLERAERHAVDLETHRARLVRVMERLERRYEDARGEDAARSERERDGRIQALERGLRDASPELPPEPVAIIERIGRLQDQLERIREVIDAMHDELEAMKGALRAGGTGQAAPVTPPSGEAASPRRAS